MLGKRLTELRKEKGLSQEQLANMLSMSRSTYAQYEVDRREPDFDTLKKLAQFFACSTDYLLGVVNCRKPEIIDLAAHRTNGRYDKPLSPETQKVVDTVIQVMERRHGYDSKGGNDDEKPPGPGKKK